MVNESKTSDSVLHSKRSYDLLNGIKRYLQTEHQDDKELLNYVQRQAGLHRE